MHHQRHKSWAARLARRRKTFISIVRNPFDHGTAEQIPRRNCWSGDHFEFFKDLTRVCWWEIWSAGADGAKLSLPNSGGRRRIPIAAAAAAEFARVCSTPTQQPSHQFEKLDRRRERNSFRRLKELAGSSCWLCCVQPTVLFSSSFTPLTWHCCSVYFFLQYTSSGPTVSQLPDWDRL